MKAGWEAQIWQRQQQELKFGTSDCKNREKLAQTTSDE